MTGEFAAIDAIRKSLRQAPRDGEVWIGDDAAVLAPTGPEPLLLAVDAVVSGVHADLSLTDLSDLGWKAMVASISDMAAMGADPAYALVSVAGPGDTDLELLFRGIGEAADEFRCPVVGGDLTNARDLVVSVTVSGTCSGKPVRRDGARAGDEVWVTGPLGASAAGLRMLRAGEPGPDPLVAAHARPVARVAEGRAARLAGATAMIDVSDGFSADAAHLAEASGITVDLLEIPVAAGASLDEALGGGEDFELVFCVPPGARVADAFRGLREPIRVGTCSSHVSGRVSGHVAGHVSGHSPGDASRLRLRGEPLAPSGWQHEW